MLWKYWLLLTLALICAYLAINIWPEVEQEIQAYQKQAGSLMWTAVYYKPFHYLLSLLLLGSGLYLLTYILRKAAYECRLAWMLKNLAVQPLLIISGCLLVMLWLGKHFGWLSLVIIGGIIAWQMWPQFIKYRTEA